MLVMQVMLRESDIINIEGVSSIDNDLYFCNLYNNYTVDLSVLSGHNLTWSATRISNYLCTCTDVNMHWCFIHSKVGGKQNVLVNKCQNFRFINQCPIQTTLFKPPTVIESTNLKQSAHLAVASSNCFNYQGTRVKVPTELNISNWRTSCANYEDQALLNYLEYDFPL